LHVFWKKSDLLEPVPAFVDVNAVLMTGFERSGNEGCRAKLRRECVNALRAAKGAQTAIVACQLRTIKAHCTRRLILRQEKPARCAGPRRRLDAGRLGHRGSGPMGRLVRRLGRGQGHHFVDDLPLRDVAVTDDRAQAAAIDGR
jgi:hypothetical protein